MVTSTTPERWLALLLIAGLTGLLWITVSQFGTGLPLFERAAGERRQIAAALPTEDYAALVDPTGVPQLRTEAGQRTLFHTDFFAPARPAPPTTRKVSMTYLGFLETSDRQKQAYLQVDQETLFRAQGGVVVADLGITEIGLQTLVLTNAAAQTVQLEFNKPKTVEVPAQ